MYNKNKAAKKTLYAYMQWYCFYRFGKRFWIDNLAIIIYKDKDISFRFLVEESEGWFDNNQNFINGSWKEFTEKSSL